MNFLARMVEKIRVFHGHEESSPRITEYEGIGSALLSADNYVFSRYPLFRPFMRHIIFRLHCIVAHLEDLLWHRRIKDSIAGQFPDAEIVVHGHIHFGPFYYTVNGRPVYRSGSWVSGGQAGVPRPPPVYTRKIRAP